jgi:hypothetical protein
MRGAGTGEQGTESKGQAYEESKRGRARDRLIKVYKEGARDRLIKVY